MIRLLESKSLVTHYHISEIIKATLIIICRIQTLAKCSSIIIFISRCHSPFFLNSLIWNRCNRNSISLVSSSLILRLGSRELLQVANETFDWFIEYLLHSGVILIIHILGRSIRNEINRATQCLTHSFIGLLLCLVLFNHSKRVSTWIKSCFCLIWTWVSIRAIKISHGFASSALVVRSLLYL